jgi:peroxiredoxin
MAQLRQDYEKFSERDTAVLVVGPENAQKFAAYFTKNNLPFPGLPDPDHNVLKQYGQEIKIFKFGRMPAQALIDKQGIVRFVHYGNSMSDIPPTDEMLGLIDDLNQEKQNVAEQKPAT